MRIYRLNVLVALLFLSQCAIPQAPAFAQEKVLKTGYADIYYPSDEVLCDFLWRIGASRTNLCEDLALARSKVDRLADRVQSILDMYPRNFHVRIDLNPRYETGLIASYLHKNRSITVYVDKVTDGILAHEVAHAVLSLYFPEPPPKKIQEILTQYVDKHLWDDY